VHGRTGYTSERTRPRTAAVYASELLLRTCRRRAATCRVGRHEQAARAAAGELGRQGARHATTSRASHASRPRRALPRASHAGEPCEQAAEPGEAAHRAEATRGHGRTPAARAGLRTAPKPRRGHGRAQDAGAGVATGKNGESGRGSRARAARRVKNARTGADRGRGGGALHRTPGGRAGRHGRAPTAMAEPRYPAEPRRGQPRAGARGPRHDGARRAGAGRGDTSVGPSQARTSRVAAPWPRARTRHGRDVRRTERDEVGNGEEKGRGEGSGTGSPRGATAAVLLWSGDGGRERRRGSDLREGERRTRVRGREKMNRGRLA
jgi:hypothetical protein